jgi:LuxR family maltose regulon positive regulatory protein
LVPRVQIIGRMLGAGQASLVLVHGPAGFGKSTVLSQHFAQLRARGIAVGWLTLDRADNEPERFMAYLAEACRAIDPAMPARDIVAHDGEAVVLELAERLTALRGRFALFLDDFEHIEKRAVLGLLRQLIDYLPPGGQVVIGSRVAPQLGLGRLRAHGKLLEIEAAQLCFSLVETTSFLRRQGGLAWADGEILRLQQRTDGWPAALWLVSLALRGKPDPRQFVATFDGANAAIADYLMEDVLSRQPQRMRDFLLRTSVLTELNGPLCDHMLQTQDSAQLLAQAERSHLFLTQETEQGWYRYHPLFGDFLRHQLEQAQPRGIALLHRRAAEWWLAQGWPARAVEHALHARDKPYLRQLLTEHAAQLLWEGRSRTLARWYAVPLVAETVVGDPMLSLTFAWALTLSHRHDASMALLDRLGAGQEEESAWMTMKALRAFILAMSDRVHESEALWRACAPRIAPERPLTYAMMGASFGFCLVAGSRFDEARQLLTRARASALQISRSFIAPMTLCIEGAVDLAEGHLRHATSSFRAALASDLQERPYGASGAVAAAFLAEALYEGQQLEEAESLLKLYLPLLEEAAAPDQLITSHAVLARIAAARGQDEAAEAILTAMEVDGHRHALPRMVASARLERARLALLQGRVQLAREQLAGGSEARIWSPFESLVMHANDIETPFIGAMRMRICTGRATSAIAPLKDALRAAQALRRRRRAHKLGLLLGEALCLAGQTAHGMRRLRDELQFAANEGFVRCCADEGPELARRIAQLRETVLAEGGPGVQALGDFMAQVMAAAGLPVTVTAPGPATSALPALPVTPPIVSPPLSERELQVLRLLAGGYRNKEIANRMFVSETTVKAHLRNINVKLGAQGRTHAVAIGRQLGLVF